MRLTLSVEIPDGTDLDDVAVAIRSSFGRAIQEDRFDGRIRDENGNSVGAWSVEDVEESIDVSIPFDEDPTYADVVTAIHLPDGPRPHGRGRPL
jgi:hypothetical protein